MNISQAIAASFNNQPIMAMKMQSVPLTNADSAFLSAIEVAAQTMPGSGTVIVNYTSSEDGTKVNFTIPVTAAVQSISPAPAAASMVS